MQFQRQTWACVQALPNRKQDETGTPELQHSGEKVGAGHGCSRHDTKRTGQAASLKPQIPNSNPQPLRTERGWVLPFHVSGSSLLGAGFYGLYYIILYYIILYYIILYYIILYYIILYYIINHKPLKFQDALSESFRVSRLIKGAVGNCRQFVLKNVSAALRGISFRLRLRIERGRSTATQIANPCGLNTKSPSYDLNKNSENISKTTCDDQGRRVRMHEEACHLVV